MDNILKTAALKYRDQGWAVFPVEGKHPLVKWSVLQKSEQTREAVDLLWTRWPAAGIGVVTGAVSNLVVVDVDAPEPPPDLLSSLAPCARTGRGGWHFYFRHPGVHVSNRVGVLPKVDVRGDGGYVVAPPSPHASGTPYRWEREGVDYPPPPSWALAPPPRPSLAPPSDVLGTPGQGRYAKVAEGERNSTLFKLACAMGRDGDDPQFILQETWAINHLRCEPPLPQEEVVAVVQSALAAGRRK